MSMHNWLHRKGVARVINSATRSWSDTGTAYVQARGPRLLAESLAAYALRRTPYLRFDWDSLLIVKTEHPGTLTYRFYFNYRRLT